MNSSALVMLATALTLLQVFDYRTTRAIFESPYAIEKNPILAWLVDRAGLKAALMTAKGGAAVLVWFMALVPLAGTGALVRDAALIVLGLLYCFVAYHNWESLRGD